MPVTCQVGQCRTSGRSGPSRHSPPFPLQRSMPTQGQWSSTLVCVEAWRSIHCASVGAVVASLRAGRMRGVHGDRTAAARHCDPAHPCITGVSLTSLVPHPAVTVVGMSATHATATAMTATASRSATTGGRRRVCRAAVMSSGPGCLVRGPVVRSVGAQRRADGAARRRDSAGCRCGGNARRCGAVGGCSLRPRRRFERGRCFRRGNCQPSGEKRGEK